MKAARVLAVTLVLATPAGAADLETFLDGLVPGLLKAHQAPGAVIAVVEGEKIRLAKGWGLAQIEAMRPMTPTTRVRVASISKLFTATAALQLVERGKLELHTDVHELLDFDLGSPYDAPITLHHLLTHTAGFDDRFLGTAVPHGQPVMPLGDYLRAHMPPVVMRPGHTLSYSNHGLALVARLVELASGEPFEAYVSEHVLRPLGMHASSFGVPHPVRDDQALPYRWAGGRFEPLWIDRLNDGPAGDLNTTARDIANFAIAHLNDGRFGESHLLAPETVALMQRRQFGHDPRLPGWAYGWSEVPLAGRRGIGHGGWVLGFHSRLWLLPEQRRAVFVSVNAELSGAFFEDLMGAWMEWEGAPPSTEAEPRPELASAGDAWVGAYLPNRRARRTFMRTLGLGQYVRVAPESEGVLQISGPLAPTRRLVLEAPDLARIEGTDRRAVLREHPEDGRPQLVLGASAYDRARALEDPRLHIAVWATAVLFGVATLVGWLLGSLARRAFGAAPSPLTRSARLGGAAAAALLVAIPVGLLTYAHDVPTVFALWMGVPAGLRLVLWLPLALAVLCVLLPVWLRRGLRPGPPAALPRLHYGLLVALGWALFASAWLHRLRGPWSG